MPSSEAPSVFISYAHEDRQIAHGLAAGLRARGSRVWIDSDEICIGDNIATRISEAINSVDFLLAIISKASVRSTWCRHELAMAVTNALNTKRVQVLPIRLGNAPMPDILTGTLYATVDASDIERMADKILVDMARHQGRVVERPLTLVPYRHRRTR